MKYTIYTDAADEYRWRLSGDNHEPLASGEGYKNKEDCLHVIALVKGSANAPIVEGDTRTETMRLMSKAAAERAARII